MSNLFRIPKPFEDSFQDFFNLSNDTRNKLISLFRKSSLQISNRRNLKEISSELNISLSMLYNIDRMIFSLFSLIDERQLPIEEIVDGLFDAVKNNDNLNVDNSDIPILKEQLIQILSLQNEHYGLSAKAMELSNDSENLFVDGKIITDIRPIFKKESTEPPVGIMVLHNLKISYYNENEEKEVYITVDSDDIERLLNILERAKQKELTIRKYFNSKDILALEFEKE